MILKIIGKLFLFFFCLIGFQSKLLGKNAVTIKEDFKFEPVVNQGLFLAYDENVPVDWDSVQLVPNADFKSLGSLANNLGISDNCYWLKFYVRNEDKQHNLTIEFISPYIPEIQFFFKSPQSTLKSKKTGLIFPLNSRTEKHFNYHFNLTIKPGESGDCYLNIKKPMTSLFFDIFVWDKTERLIYNEKERSFLGFYFFILFLFISIMAFAQLIVKINRYHWFYIFSSIFFTGIIFLDLGLGNLFLFTSKPIFSFLSVFILVTLFFICHTQFLRQFLKGQKNERFFSIYFKFLYAYSLLVIVYLLFIIFETYLSKTTFELPLLFIRINLVFYVLYTLLIILLIFNDLIDKRLIFSNLSVLFIFSFRVIGGILLLLEYMGYSKNMVHFNQTYLDFFYPITFTLNSAFMLGFVIEIVGIFIVIAYRVLKIYHQNAENLLRNSEERINNFSALMMGIEHERQRIAQDLHDGLGVLLSTIKMKLSIENETEQKQQKLGNLMGDIDIALEDIRGISRNLMPITLSKLGFNRAIEELIQNIRISNPNLDIELIKIVDNERLIEPVGVNLYRIIQELLQNVLKHSKASELIIQLFSRDDVFVLMVEDNGVGFDVLDKKTGGIGLENVKYRVVSMQGLLNVDSFKGKGSTITIEIPLENVYLD